MSGFGEKIVEEIWGGLNPILSVPRSIFFILLCIGLTPLNEEFFTFNLFLGQLSEILELVQRAFSEILLWKISFAFCASFIGGPFLGYFINKYWTKNNHINKADKLKANAQVIQKGVDIKVLAGRRNQGLKVINFLRIFGEVLSTLLIIYFYWIINNHTSFIESGMSFLGGFLAWAALMYLVSQRVFIVFMTDIYPFNLAVKN